MAIEIGIGNFSNKASSNKVTVDTVVELTELGRDKLDSDLIQGRSERVMQTLSELGPTSITGIEKDTSINTDTLKSLVKNLVKKRYLRVNSSGE